MCHYEVAELFGVSMERARQYETRGLREIRAALMPLWQEWGP